MGFTKALYYPTIDIINEEWLKTAVLFWDEICTIVPESISNPYRENTTQYLHDEGLLTPISINPDSRIVEEISVDAVNYLNTNEGFQCLTRNNQHSVIHRDKLPRDISRLFRMHPEKLPYEIQHILREDFTHDGWLNVNSDFAIYYMTLLANKISNNHSIALLTDNVFSANLSDKVRLDNQIAIGIDDYHFRRNTRYINLAQGILVNTVIESIRIKPTTSLVDIINFKRKYQDELGRFRTNLSEITSTVSSDKSFDVIRQEVEDIYKDKFLPSYNDCKKALNGAGIKWFSDNIMKVSAISASSTGIPIACGLSVPQALLAGAGISLVASLISYNVDRQRDLRQNPYSYLLSVNRSL